MTALPAGAKCAHHPTLDALYVCHRCGTFFDEQCARRTRPEAVPLCKSCWDLRDQKVAPNVEYSETRMQTTGLVLGCCCVLPIPVLLIASLVVNLIALAKAKTEKQLAVRWKPIVGLCVTCFGILELVGIIAWAANH